MLHTLFFALFLHTTAGPVDWADAGRDWTSFLGIFAMVGAIGFRALVIGRIAKWERGGLDAEPRLAVFRQATANAATIGVIGILIVALTFLTNLVEASADAAQASSEPDGVPPILVGIIFLVTLTGFLMARVTASRDGKAGWCIAAVGVLSVIFNEAVAPLLHGRWLAIVNPLHITGGSLWLGTLFVLVVAGLPAVLHRTVAHAYRGPLVADLVNAFSPIALCGSALLGVTGLITAWKHVKYLSALWTTSYGEALLIKLCLVAIVVALGAWNWRRMRPLLGSEPAAHAIRRSASAELAFALAVLIVTAVLVNLPTPKAPIP